MGIKIDEEFRLLIPAMSRDDYQSLEKSLKENGCREPLKVWDGILIDGHNRYEICTRLKIPYEITQLEIADRSAVLMWMLDVSLSRRNLTTFNKTVLVLKSKEVLAAQAKKKLSDGGKEKGLMNSSKALNVRKILAEKADVSEDTIRKVEKIKETASEEVLSKLSIGEVTINKAFNDLPKKKEKKPKSIPKPSRFCKVTCLKEYDALGKKVCLRLSDDVFRASLEKLLG